MSALNPGLCKVPSKQIVMFFTPGWELAWLKRLLWGLSFIFEANPQFFLGRIFSVDTAQISVLHRFHTALISIGFSRTKGVASCMKLLVLEQQICLALFPPVLCNAEEISAVGRTM